MRTVAIDIDDVLANTTKSLIDNYSEKIGSAMPYGDITSYDYWQSLGVLSNKEAIDIVHGYEKEGYPGLTPTDESIDGVKKLLTRFILVVVTARPPEQRLATENWLNKYYGNIFSDLVMTGNPYTSNSHTTKAEECIRLGAAYLIDDQFKHIEEARNVGISGLLFGEYEWNFAKNLPSGITKVRNWAEVGSYFEED